MTPRHRQLKTENNRGQWVGTSGQFIDQVRIVTIKLSIFSCEDTAQPVLMSVCQSVCLCVWGHSANFKVPKGYQRLPGVTKGLPKVVPCHSRLHAVPWECRHFNELGCSSKSRNAVPWHWKQFHDLARSSTSLHLATEAYMQYHEHEWSSMGMQVLMFWRL